MTGTVKAVGMTGLTLAGGYGPLIGKHGLALDNLLSAEVVLADGRKIIASDDDDRDMLWALRGGGGNFGVVTGSCHRLHPLPVVLAGLLLFPLSEAASVLRGYRELIAEAPDALTVMSGFLSSPDAGPMLFLSPTWSGDQSEGGPFISRLAHLGAPVVAQVGPMTYQDALSLFDATVVNGRHYAVRTRWLTHLTEDTVSLLTEAARAVTSPFSVIALHHFHGAACRVAPYATAFATRRVHTLVEIIAAWAPSETDCEHRHVRWADTLSGALAPHALPGSYPSA